MYSTNLMFHLKMAGDMYLENLDEFIFDEDKVVTYRWLSRTLSVHVNEAKQMLETYAEVQKRKPYPPSIGITYLLSGVQERGNGVKVNKVCVVSDKDLEETEAAMTEVISKHIYSIQKAILKDSNSLYMTDYQIIKDNIRQPNRFSAIQCADAKARTPEELAELGVLSGHPTTSTTTPPKPKLNGSAEKHVIESLKQEPKKASAGQGKKGQITSFGGFAASNGRGSSEKSDRKEQADSSRQKEEQKHTVPSSKAKGGMMAFLNRPSTVKPKTEEKSPVAKQPAPTTQRVQDPPKTTKEPERSTESMREEKRGGKAKRKAARINVSDSDSEEERQTAKRRRRIIQQDSSSSEEELSDMEDSPIPPTPPPAPANINSSDSEEEVATKGSSHMPSETGDAGSAASLLGSNGKRRRRKRVLKSKTTIDDEGCMVTEKVWESDWTDVSDDEAPPPKKTAPSATAVPQTSLKEGGDKTGEEEGDKKKKTSPGSGKTKQRSLMSFFKRK